MTDHALWGWLATMLVGVALGGLACAAEGGEPDLETQPPQEAKKTADAADQADPQQVRPYPTAHISNGLVDLVVCVPDPETGFYRGTRFDWSGHIEQATHKGHTFFEFWKGKHDPTRHDHGIGTPEEFGMDNPLGYEEAKPGETFIKIGVGHLVKAKDAKYKFHGKYDLKKPGLWKTTRGEDYVESVQTVTHDRGWGYVYTKRISLPKGKAAFLIRHTLENTGTRSIDTTHYCHNFIRIDKTPVGNGNYRLRLPFVPRGDIKDKGDPVITDKQIVLTGEIKGSFWAGLEMEGDWKEEHNAFLVENLKTGAAVECTGDLAPVKYSVYAEKTALCPEPFVPIKVAPGEKLTWTNTYVLSADDSE